MTTPEFRPYMGILILWGIWIHACNGQGPPHSIANKASPSPQRTEIIGHPSPFQAGPVYDTGLVSQYIRCIFQDSKGNYWFGPAGQSVARYDGSTLRYFSKAEFFQGNHTVDRDYGNSVHAIAEDHRGNIWFGTDQGAIRYDGQRFRSYTQIHGLSSIEVGRKSVFVDHTGKLWVGTREGVFQYDPAADSLGAPCFSRFQLLPSIPVNDIMEDQTGNIWFASRDKGVFRYDRQEIHHLAEQAGLGNNYGGGMAQDNAGNYWFTMQDGICRYDGKTFTEYTTEDGLGGREVWGIYIEQSGIIWVTARGSTTRFDPLVPLSSPRAFTVFTPADGLNCCVQSMYQDRSGRMWWGTGQGLYRFDGQHFYQVKQHGPW